MESSDTPAGDGASRGGHPEDAAPPGANPEDVSPPGAHAEDAAPSAGAWPPPPPAAWTPPPPPGEGWVPPAAPAAGSPAGSEPSGAWPPPAPPGWGVAPPPPPAPPAWGPPPPPPAWGTAPAPSGWTPQPAWAVPAGWAGTADPRQGWDARPPAPAVIGVGGFRARSVGELLDGAISLYRRNFLLIVAIAALVQVPFALLDLVLRRAVDLSGHLTALQNNLHVITQQQGSGVSVSPGQTDALTGDAGALVAYQGIVLLIQLLLVRPLGLAATTRAVSDRYLDRPATVESSYAAALRRLPSLLAMTLLQVVLVIAALVAGALVIVLFSVIGTPVVGVLAGGAVMVAGAMVVFVRMQVAAQAIVLEGLSGRAGLRRSWRLLAGSFWRTLGLVVLLQIIYLVVVAVLGLPAQAVGSAVGGGTGQVFAVAAEAVAGVFALPVIFITLTLYYYDVRIRREAFDIEMLAASL